MFMGPLGLYKPKSIAKERNGFQIVDTPKIAKHHVVIGLFAIDHELNRTLLLLHEPSTVGTKGKSTCKSRTDLGPP
jgi:hypothetical protein